MLYSSKMSFKSKPRLCKSCTIIDQRKMFANDRQFLALDLCYCSECQTKLETYYASLGQTFSVPVEDVYKGIIPHPPPRV